MRLDDFLSTVGVVKRRTTAKELARNGLVLVNDRKAKPACQVNVRDVISIRGTHPVTIEVLDLPSGSVPKEHRDRFFKLLSQKP